MIQGWWVSVQRKNGGSKSYTRVLKGLIMHISLSMSPWPMIINCQMSGRLILPHHMRLNTSIFIFLIHKLSALLSSWRCFHLIVVNILFSLLIAFSILDSWRKYKCLGMMSLYMFWCGISTSIWMSEWDCQNLWGIKTRWEFWGTNVNC